MKKYLPVLICLVTLDLLTAGQQPSLPSFVNNPDTPWKGYVFIIPIEKRNTKKEVENSANWEYLGTADKITVRPGPGQKQACQLIVDERDTYVLTTGVRKLKSQIRIIAWKGDEFYYVKEFISTNSYPFTIYNEEEKISSPKTI